MYKVTKAIEFCYGHRLMNYDGKCRHLHGHNGKVEIELETDKLDAIGMVRDFTEVKEVVAGWLDRELDHKMLLRKDDPALPMLQKMNEPVFLFDANPTAESIAKLIFEFVRSKGFPVSEVRMWESESSFAAYKGL
ncbi:MAG TPA: 6-carboxytetrahydropterin synthase [Nitrospiria bacterium]|nr:6-carboxytetrahydropterin synthase [Nitrospiria bacterium]